MQKITSDAVLKIGFNLWKKILLEIGKRKVRNLEQIKAFAYDMLVSMVIVSSGHEKDERIKFRKERVYKLIIAIQVVERAKPNKVRDAYSKLIKIMCDIYKDEYSKAVFKDENKRLKDNLRKREKYNLDKTQKKLNRKPRKQSK